MNGANPEIIGTSATGAAITTKSPDTKISYSGVFSGYCNIINAGNDYGVIGGGLRNTISGVYSFIGTGFTNNVQSGSNNTIINGTDNNIVIGTNAFIGTGSNNYVINHWGTIENGDNNRLIDGSYDTIGNGTSNLISSNNTHVNFYDTIINGNSNHISDTTPPDAMQQSILYYNGINNGEVNCITNSGYASTVRANSIGNGLCNQIINNVAMGNALYNTIGNGVCNTITNTNHSFIGSGYKNQITGNCSFISSGANNTVSGAYSSILGGSGNNDNGYPYTGIFGNGITVPVGGVPGPSSFWVNELVAPSMPIGLPGPTQPPGYPTGSLWYYPDAFGNNVVYVVI
jgi:hypothetical protein